MALYTEPNPTAIQTNQLFYFLLPLTRSAADNKALILPFAGAFISCAFPYHSRRQRLIFPLPNSCVAAGEK
jgi:hypothetical protein